MASLWTGCIRPNARAARLRRGLRGGDACPPRSSRRRASGPRASGPQRLDRAPNFGFAQGFEIYVMPERSQRRQGARQARRENPNNSASRGTDAEHAHLRPRVPARPRPRALVPLSAHDGRPSVRLRRRTRLCSGTSYSDAYDNSIRWVDSLLGHPLCTRWTQCATCSSAPSSYSAPTTARPSASTTERDTPATCTPR